MNDLGIADEHSTEAEQRPSEQLPDDGSRRPGRSARIALGSTAALVALAAAVNWAARRIERSHPPIGNFIEVDGVRVHYVDVGEGEPVVLLQPSDDAYAGQEYLGDRLLLA